MAECKFIHPTFIPLYPGYIYGVTLHGLTCNYSYPLLGMLRKHIENRRNKHELLFPLYAKKE